MSPSAPVSSEAAALSGGVRRLARTAFGDERIRFLLTGGFNTVFGYLCFAVIQFLFGHVIGYVGSVLVSHVVSSTVAFVLYRRVVFRVRGSIALDYVRFQSVYLLSLLINVLALPVLVESMGLNVYVAQAIVVVVTTGVSFLGHKFFSFRRPGPAETAAGADVSPDAPTTLRSAIVHSWRTSNALVYAGAAVLASGLAAFAMQIWRMDISIPLTYGGDAMTNAVVFKSVVETGWYEVQPHLGAPYGQIFFDWPNSDHLGLIYGRAASLFTHDFIAIMNSYFLIGFPLIALAAVWFFRLVGVSKLMTLALATLYAIAPYHFLRGESHLWLSTYFPIPFVVGLLVIVLRGGALWGFGGRGASWMARLRSPGVRTVLIMGMVATANTYYTIFTLLLLAVAGLVTLVRTKSWRRFFGAAVAGVVGVVVLGINMAPDVIYSAVNGSNGAAVVRVPVGTEVYQLKLMQLLLPIPGHRISVLRQLRTYYDTNFPLPGEQPAMGGLAAVGLLMLLGFAIYSVVASVGRRAPRSALAESLGPLAVLLLFGLLLATTGGLSTIIGFFTSDIRGWNRIVIVLALLSLAAVGLVADAVFRRVTARRVESRRVRGVLAALLATVLVLASYVDQVPFTAAPLYEITAAAYRADAKLVSDIRAEAGPDAKILQLPYRDFPESASSNGIPDSDQLKFFLHSTDLYWSAGGIKGRPQAEWVKAAERLPAPELARAARAAGFAGVLIDRTALEDDADEVTDDLQKELGDPAVESPDGRYRYFDLAVEDSKLSAALSPGEIKDLGAAVVGPVLVRPDPDIETGYDVIDLVKPYHPRLLVDNPRDEPVEIVISMKVTFTPGPTVLRFTQPDGTATDVELGQRPRTVEIEATAQPGRTWIDVTSVSGVPIPGRIPSAVAIKYEDIRVDDVAMTRLLAVDD